MSGLLLTGEQVSAHWAAATNHLPTTTRQMGFRRYLSYRRMEVPLCMKEKNMDSMIVDTEAGEVLDVFALPGKVMVAEVPAGERGMFVAWHTITPDAADEMAARLTAAAARARQ